VTNNGPSDASGVTVTDNLPAEIASFTTAGCAEDPAGSPTCTLGTIANGATASFTIAAVIDGATPEGTDVTNTASIGAVNETLTNTGNDSATETVNVNSSADIQVTITDDADHAVAGTDVTYTIDVDNLGTDGATNPTVTITLPPGTTFVSSNPPAGGACNPPSGGQVTCTLPDIANGGNEQVTIVVHVPSDAADGSSFDLTVTGGSDAGDLFPLNNTALTENTTIDREFDLVVTKTADPATLNPAGDPTGEIVAGRVVTYNIAVTNNGDSDASNVVVTDTLPIPAGGATLTFVNATSTAGTCSEAGGTVTCNVGNVANGATVDISVAARLSSSGVAGDTLTNNAAVTFDASETGTNLGNNSVNEIQTIVRIVNIRIIQTFNPEPPEAGEDLVVKVTIINDGPSDATGVTFDVDVPNDPLIVLQSATAGCVLTQRPTFPESVACNVGNLNAGVAAQFDIDLTVGVDETTPPGTPLPFPVTVITVPPSGPPTFVPPGNPNVVRVVDLEVDVQSDPSPAVAGTDLTYTVSVTNNGPVFDATNVQSTLQLPAGTTFVPTGGGATAVSFRSFQFLATSSDCLPTVADPTIVTCNFGTVAVGNTETESLDVTVTVAPSLVEGANLDATASVSATENEGNPANNTAPEQTPSTRQSDVVAVDIAAPSSATAGQTFNLDLTIRNTGPSDAGDAKVTYQLPPGVEFVGSVPPGICVQVGSNIECDLSSLGNGSGDIPVGSQIGFSITLRATQTGTIDHEINAGSASADPDPTNNDLVDQTQSSQGNQPAPTNTPGPTSTPVPPLPTPQVTACSSNIQAPPGVVLWCRQLQFFDQNGGQVSSVLPGQQKDFSYTLTTANLDLMDGRPGALNEHALGRINYQWRSSMNPNLWFSISSLYSVGPPALVMTTRFSGTHILLWTPTGTPEETATPTPVPEAATATPVPASTPPPEPTPDRRTPVALPSTGGFPPANFVRPSSGEVGAGVGFCDPDDPNRRFPRNGEVLRCIVLTITDGSGTPIGDAPQGESIDIISDLIQEEVEKLGGRGAVLGRFLAKDIIYQRVEPDSNPASWLDRQTLYSVGQLGSQSMLTNTTQSGTYILFLRSAPALPVTGDVGLGNSLLWMFALLGAALVAAGVFLPRFTRRGSIQP
jgi:uncharacterized repeat protein (TIGR01451 family)